MARAGTRKQRQDYRELTGPGLLRLRLLFRVSERWSRPRENELRAIRRQGRNLVLYRLAVLAEEKAKNRRVRWQTAIFGDPEFAAALKRTNLGGLIGGHQRPYRALFIKKSPYQVRPTKYKELVEVAVETGHPEVLSGFSVDVAGLLKRATSRHTRTPLGKLRNQVAFLENLAELLETEYGLDLWKFVKPELDQDKLRKAFREQSLPAEAKKMVYRTPPTYALKIDPLH